MIEYAALKPPANERSGVKLYLFIVIFGVCLLFGYLTISVTTLSDYKTVIVLASRHLDFNKEDSKTATNLTETSLLTLSANVVNKTTTSSTIKSAGPSASLVHKTTTIPKVKSAGSPVSPVNKPYVWEANKNGADRFLCVLPEQDPWHPEIMPYVDSSYPKCKPNATRLTSLINGKVVLSDEGSKQDYKCTARCCWANGDWYPVFDDFKDISSFEAKCDIVEVNCLSNKTSAKYGMLHTQIVEVEDNMDYGTHLKNDTKPKPSLENDKPSVYLMIFDATSTSQFTRTMQRTHTELTDYFQAIPFYYVNKVGINSRPNAYPLFLGKTYQNLTQNPYSPGIPAQMSDAESEAPLDNQTTYIGHRFRDAGFHTFGAEDWSTFVLAYPGNWGFKRTPLKHYFQPSSARQSKEPIVSTFKDLCNESYNRTLTYLSQFWSSYKNQSQFSYVWNIDLGHDTPNGLFHADDDVYRLLRKHRKRLENSFVFFLGDHGMRYGGIRSTRPGEVEDQSPLFMLATPKKYRNTGLNDMLWENSRKLATHYDTHATLRHLAEMASSGDYSDLVNPSREPKRIDLGHSYFRPLPGPRHCGSLRIPYDLCLCKKDFLPPLDKEMNDKIVKILADFGMAHLKKTLANDNVTAMCEVLSPVYSETIVTPMVNPDTASKLALFKLKLVVTPGTGVFEGYLTLDAENIPSMSSKDLARLSGYGSEGDCVTRKNPLSEPICKCLPQFMPTTTKPEP